MNAPVVETKLGKLKGAYRDNVDGGQYISFRGVPFAEPPTGELRFKVIKIYMIFYFLKIYFY